MAAGLGFKDFTTGEVLTAADVDGYLMQGVWVFASATARDAAVTSPQEGNFAYLKDTNVTTYYTGSAWANLDTTGMTNPMTTTGDTIYSSSGSTPARLGIGTAGQVLTVNSGATAPEWAAPAGGGKVLQVVYGSTSTAFESTTNSFADSGLTATITPSSATSKVLVLINQIVAKTGGDTYIASDLLRNSTSLVNVGTFDLTGYAGNNGGAASNYIGAISASILDTPASTSALTYKTQYKNPNAVGSVRANQFALSTMILMEIGA